MAQKRECPKLITARQARLQFTSDDFVQSILAINHAILEAAPNSHRVTVNIPTGRKENGTVVSYVVAQRLRENGFSVIMIHDPENGSTELTIDWDNIVAWEDK